MARTAVLPEATPVGALSALSATSEHRGRAGGRGQPYCVPEPSGFSFAIVSAPCSRTQLIGSRECREEIHEEADLGRRDRGDAVRRCRGAGARTELEVVAAPQPRP